MREKFEKDGHHPGAANQIYPGGGKNLGGRARSARDFFCPPLSIFCPPPEGSSGGGKKCSEGGKNYSILKNKQIWQQKNIYFICIDDVWWYIIT